MKIEIWQDEFAESPSDGAGKDGTFLMAWHLHELWVPAPGHGRGTEPKDWVDEFRHTHKLYPIEAYIHSGVRIYRQGGCGIDRQWDVCTNVGCVAVPNDWPDHDATVDSVIDEWNQYLSGDVWGYTIIDDDGLVVDSCGGIYGRDEAVAEAEAASMAKGGTA